MLQLREGRFYRNREGRKIGPLIQNSNHQFSATFTTKDGSITWFSNGKVMADDTKLPTDLVEVWTYEDEEQYTRTKNMFHAMEAYLHGKWIESKHIDLDFWNVTKYPKWNAERYEYRVYQEPKIRDSINWSHVEPNFICHARDINGNTRLYKARPNMSEWGWHIGETSSVSAHAFVSFKVGNVDWRDSLVFRPGYEPK